MASKKKNVTPGEHVVNGLRAGIGTFNEKLVKEVKALGQEVIDRAEDLVGNGDLITDFNIWLCFYANGGAPPRIEVTRSHYSHHYLDDVILNKEKE